MSRTLTGLAIASVVAAGLLGCTGTVIEDGITRFAGSANLTASQSFNDHIDLHWETAGPTATYAVYRARVDDSDFVRVANRLEDCDFSDAPLEHSQTYYYYVVAYSADRERTGVSGVAVGKTTPAPAPQPNTPVASDGTYPDRIQITWHQDWGVESYQLEVAETPEGPWEVLTIETIAVSFVHEGRAEGETRYYRLIAGISGRPGSLPSGVEEGSTGVRPAISFEQYLKPSNTGDIDYFGWHAALSADGNTLAVGAYFEDSDAVGINGDESNNNRPGSGAVYVFVRDETGWTQQAYVKASNPGEHNRFGHAVALSDDGNTLAVGSWGEQSSAASVNGNQNDNSLTNAGAVYVFVRTTAIWTQEAYIKASNTGPDAFGYLLDLSGDGNTLAVTAYGESSAATGINGDGTDDSLETSGAAYVFVRDGSTWTQQAYVKASNPRASDMFGMSVALAGDGNTLAVGAVLEDGQSAGINGDQEDIEGYGDFGAVYVYRRNEDAWAQEAYVKASVPTQADRFGNAVSLSDTGDFLAVTSETTLYLFARDQAGWTQEGEGNLGGYSVSLSGDGGRLLVSDRVDSTNAVGINAEPQEEPLFRSGVAFLFTRTEGGAWTLPASIKAPNAEAGDQFGSCVVMAGDGNSLVIGAFEEDGGSNGVDGDPTDNSAQDAGAIYTYVVP